MRSIPLALLLLVVVAGCAQPGKKFSEVAPTIPALSSEQTRLTFYRTWAYYAGGLDARVSINGKRRMEVPTKAFSYVDVPPGKHTIAIDFFGAFGDFEISVDVAKSREYYFELGSSVVMADTIFLGNFLANLNAIERINNAYGNSHAIAVKDTKAKLLRNGSQIMIVPVSKERAMSMLGEMGYKPANAD